MAIAFRAASSNKTDGAGTLAVTKPTGLTVDDYIIAVVNTEQAITSAPSGWSLFAETTTPLAHFYIYKRIADSNDVAASSFTWATGGAGGIMAGIVAFSGANTVASPQSSGGDGVSSTATPTFTNGVTPALANSMLVMCIGYNQNSNIALGGYAITTSNPTWTEAVDRASDALDSGVAIAYALRPQTTATGSWSCTGGTASSNYEGFLLALRPKIEVTVTDTVTLTETHQESFSMPVVDTVTLTESETTTKQNPITNTTKHSTSWTNLSKS